MPRLTVAPSAPPAQATCADKGRVAALHGMPRNCPQEPRPLHSQTQPATCQDFERMTSALVPFQKSLLPLQRSHCQSESESREGRQVALVGMEPGCTSRPDQALHGRSQQLWSELEKLGTKGCICVGVYVFIYMHSFFSEAWGRLMWLNYTIQKQGS